MDKGYYLVRAMSQSRDDFDVFFKNNVVAVGWGDVEKKMETLIRGQENER